MKSSTSSSNGMLVAIDVGGTKTQAASFDTSTGALQRCRIDTHADGLTGRPALHRIIHEVKVSLRLDPNAPLLGLAAVFPGVVRRHQLLMAPNAPGLEGVSLHEELVAAFGDALIVLDNDVKAGAIAEHVWGALRGTEHALYLNIGTGLAAAAIIHGEVYRGGHGAALEIGYQLTPFLDGIDSARWKGWQDGVAPMEDLFSGAALDDLARRTLGSEHGAKDLFESSEPALQQQLQRRMDALSAQLVNLAIAFDVETIAIGGGVNRQFPMLEANLTRLLQRLVPFPPALVRARFAEDAPLWGAMELARRAAALPPLPDAIFDTSANKSTRDAGPRAATRYR
ncbi:ROK family protein [Dyella psychrodurans]|uniref:ROK family protein n=1 Tax=Dyella psychrodurans TaxID=1927960 RepID=UPI0018F523BC|nr:ROK family protein [Dyella psychrodurans]